MALDPEFALAWSRLALTYQSAGNNTERGGAEWNAKALRATSRALELAPELPSVLAAAAGMSAQLRDRTEAERRLQKARDLATGSENVWQDSGGFLLNVGRPREAAEYFRRAKLAEPLLTVPPVLLTMAYEMSGDFDRAAAELTRSAQLGDQGFAEGNMLLLAITRRDRAQIEAHIKGQIEKSASAAPTYAALLATMQSRLDEPQAALAELRRRADDPDFQNAASLWVLAHWAAYFHDPELSLRLLRTAAGSGGSVPAVLWRAIEKETRRLPAFKDLVRDLGLVDYWRASGSWGEFCRPVGRDDFECS